MMDRLIAREVKRAALTKNCKHEFVDYIIPDPADKRYKLKPHNTEVFGNSHTVVYCKKCGAGRLI